MHEQAAKFFDLFQGLNRAYGEYTLSGYTGASGKAEGKARTVLGPPTVELWDQHLTGSAGLGVIPIRDDATCRFGAIDIDSYENFNVEALAARLDEDKRPVVVCRTKSGGAHVYLFTSEPVPANLMRAKLAELADALGFQDAEIFPKQSALSSEKDVGSWINMPYFDGKRTTRYAVSKGKPLSASAFVDLAKQRSVLRAELQDLSFSAEHLEGLEDAPPCLVKLCAQGFPEGTRNEGLFNLGVYCRNRYGDAWRPHLEEMNQKFMTPNLRAKEVLGIIKSLDRKAYYYKCDEPPIAGTCSRKVCRSRKYGIAGGDEQPPYELGTLTKIETDPPIWIIDVDGVRMELTTKDLRIQDRFRELCIDRLNKFPKRMKQGAYEALIANRLENVEVIGAPEDAGPRGQFLYYLERFLLKSPAKMQSQLLLGRRWKHQGRVYFRSSDLITFLEKNKFKEFTAKKIWGILRDIGGGSEQFHLKGACVRCWHMPAPQEQTEAHDIPDMKKKEEF